MLDSAMTWNRFADETGLTSAAAGQKQLCSRGIKSKNLPPPLTEQEVGGRWCGPPNSVRRDIILESVAPPGVHETCSTTDCSERHEFFKDLYRHLLTDINNTSFNLLHQFTLKMSLFFTDWMLFQQSQLLFPDFHSFLCFCQLNKRHVLFCPLI